MEDQSSLEKKFNSVINDSDSVQVPNKNFDISHKALWSKGYYDSNGVALLGNRIHGLTHFSYRNGNPDDYLGAILKKLREAGEEQLEAVVMGGSRVHYNRIRELLEENQIPLIGSVREVGSERKDLVIIPTTKEVMMYSFAGEGYFKLA